MTDKAHSNLNGYLKREVVTESTGDPEHELFLEDGVVAAHDCPGALGTLTRDLQRDHRVRSPALLIAGKISKERSPMLISLTYVVIK